MKPKIPLLRFLALAGSSLFAITTASAQTDYYWDSNSTTAGFGNTAGTWGTSAFWGTVAAGTGATANTTITSLDTVNFGTATLNYATSNIGVAAGGVTTGSIVMGAGQTTAINLGTAGNAITIHSGITKNAGSAALTFVSPVTLGGAQTWTNNSTNALTLNSTLNLDGNKLTTGGSGTTSLAGAAAAVVSGAGGIDATGGRLTLGAGQAPAHTYSGDTTITGGAVVLYSANLSANSNVNLNGGVLESYWTGGLSRAIGTGGNQIRITGGESGFGMNGSNGATFTLGALTWGDTNFNPSKLLLQTQYSQGTSSLTLASAINLNGANRTVVAHQGLAGTATSTITGNITNSTGTAGFVKEGAGLLNLTGSNSYNGGTTISAGTLAFGSIAAMPNSGAVAVNSATLGVEVGGAGDWTGGTSGVGTLGGLLAGLGGAGSSTVSYSGNVGLRLTMTGNTTYSSSIANVGTSLALTKAGNSSLTLSGNNSYSGGTTLIAGALSVGSNTALGTGTVALNGGTIQSDSATARTLTNAVTIGGDFTVGGTGNMTFSDTGNTALGATRTIQVANGITAEFAQSFSGTGGLTKGNTIGGILKLSGTSSYTGKTTINDNAGGYNVLEVSVLANGGSNSSIGASTNAASNLLLKNGTALRYVGSTDAVTDRAFTIDSGTAGHGINIESSGSGTLTFSSSGPAFAYGGGPTGRYITFGGTNTGNNTLGKAITGAQTINKAGTGKWRFSADNSYTGPTNINAGTLEISGTGDINQSSGISVAAGASFVYNSTTALTVAPTLAGSGTSNRAVLGGSGPINASVTLNDLGDVLSPGNSPGTQVFGTNQTWTSFSYDWELNDWSDSLVGTNFDQIQVTGSLNLDGSIYALNILSLDSLNAAGLVGDGGGNPFAETDNSWTILTTTGGIIDFNPLEWTINAAGFLDTDAGTWGLSQSGNNLVLTYTAAIPEPGAALLGSLGLLALLRRRRA